MRISITYMLVAAAVIGCGSSDVTDTGGGDSGNHTDNTAQINSLLAEITASQNAVAQGAAAGGAADRAPLPDVAPSAGTRTGGAVRFDQAPDNAALCTPDSTAVMWHCPMTISPVGDTLHVSFQFLDTANAPQMNFNPTTTAAIRRVSDSYYKRSQDVQTQNGPVAAVQVDTQHQDIVLSGILTGTHEQNGTGNIIHVIAEEGHDTAFITAPTTTTGVLTTQGVPYPVGGSYTAVVHTVQGASTSTTTQVTSFDGTKVATLVISFAQGGTPRTCTYDMTSIAAPVCTGGPSGPP